MENNSQKINIDDFKKKYPEIARMTVAEVVATELFAKKLDVTIKCYKGTKANFYAFLSLKKDKTLEPENFRKEYVACLDKESKMPYTKRLTVLIIGDDAYRRTVKQMMEEYDKKHNLKMHF